MGFAALLIGLATVVLIRIPVIGRFSFGGKEITKSPKARGEAPYGSGEYGMGHAASIHDPP
jgi:hypothetical protein